MTRGWVCLGRMDEDVEVCGSQRGDLGERHRVRTVLVPRAMVWLRRGDQADVDRAQVYADRQGYRVFTYPADEKHPLERVKEALRYARG